MDQVIMLGKDLFKVESNADLSNESYKALVLFYAPLIGKDALYLYEYLQVKDIRYNFEEISKILNSLLISIESFEDSIKKLNQYRLLNTLKAKNEEKYIFILNKPLTITQFIKNDIFVRDFILKTSGEYYQSLLKNITSFDRHDDFDDVSEKIDPSILSSWSKYDESFLQEGRNASSYDFGTFFDVNEFLKDVSLNLLPMRFRTNENLKEMALLADLYNVSYDKMRTFLPRVAANSSDTFDLNLLRYCCEHASGEFKTISDGEYDVPCELFLMNKQDGKEVTNFDKKIIYALNHDYRLKPSVINVLLEYSLNNCNNMLLEKYLYAIASDLHRNNIDTAQKALDRLSGVKLKKPTIQPDYQSDNNISFDESEFDAIMKRR